MISRSKHLREWPFEVAMLLAVSLLVFGPNLSKATIYRDDWYYAVDRLKGGPGVFQEMFREDRPARAPLFESYYQLFGIRPLPYHVAGFLWRFLGALGALWLFHLLWPGNRKAARWMALLFLIYPGYLHWMQGFENQPHAVSLCLEVFSIAMTLKAIQPAPLARRIGWWLGSILAGWAYLALVDFGIGMEVFRLLCVYIVVGHERPSLLLLGRAWQAARMWVVAAVVPAGFLFWQVFVFHSERSATNIGAQLKVLLDSPLLTGLWWLVRLVQSTALEGLLAWFGSHAQEVFSFRLREILLGLGCAFLASALVLLADWRLGRRFDRDAPQDGASPARGPWQAEAIWVGLIGVVAGVLPIVLMNRYVNFEAYSHYSLPASLAAAMLAGGLVLSAPTRRMQAACLATLVVLASLTHFVASEQVTQEEATISRFWQEVAWRAPGISAQTTLLIRYPSVKYGEDSDAAAGPANLTYFPDPANQIPVKYELTALGQMDYTSKVIMMGEDGTWGYRTHIADVRYQNLLVLSQSSKNACVRAIDGRWPYYSSNDPTDVLLIGERSKIERIVTTGESPRLRADVFGPEPGHGWCYYFEKADLAVQRGDWESARQLGDEALSRILRPMDPVEWAPFVQAYAVLGDRDRMAATIPRVGEDHFARLQVCSLLTRMQEAGYSFAPDIRSLIQEGFCLRGG